MKPPDARRATSRSLALSGVLFALLFLIGWFVSGGDAPDYGAPDQDWTNWADDNQWKSRVGAFAMLLAGFVFLHFAARVRTVLGDVERSVRGSTELARVAVAGAITGMAGMVMAIVIVSSATTEGGEANPAVTRAIASASAGPFLLSAMGFAAFLMAAGVITLQSDALPRWTGVVALRSKATRSPVGPVSSRSSGRSRFSSRSPRFSQGSAKTASSASASSPASWRS
jgi:hypothetical protein